MNINELLKLAKNKKSILLSAYIIILEIDTYREAANKINEKLGTRYTPVYISDMINGHKRLPEKLTDLARRELIEYLEPDKAKELNKVLGLVNLTD